MAGKRKAPPRIPVTSAKDARPMCNVRSNYAAPRSDDEYPEVQDQQPTSEVQQALGLNVEQEL
jgi:hypothetical protein